MVSIALSTLVLGFQTVGGTTLSPVVEWHEWKRSRIESLKAPTGWLSVSALHKITKGYTTLGSAKESDLVLREGSVGSKAGTIIRQGEKFVFQSHPSTNAIVAGETIDRVSLSDPESARTTVLQLGDVSLTVIKRGPDHYVRVWDPGNERKNTFPGITTFPYRPDWRVTAKLVRFAKPINIPVTNVLGITEPTPHLGKAIFSFNGETYSLLVQDGGDRLSLLFGDRSNTSTTYGSGRFLVSEPIEGDTVVLDFNKAYSPPCAFTDFATCPLPIAQNKLPFAVNAGEKRINRWKGAH